MERKYFIKTLSLGLLGFYACKGFGIKSDLKKPLGVQLYTVRNEVSKNLDQTLEKLAALGYTNLEIYGYDGTFFGKTPKQFAEILKNTGLKLISSHHIAGIKEKSKGTLSDGWKNAVEDMAFLDAKYMVCSYLFPNERNSEVYLSLPNLLNRCGEITQEGGIQFAYHNHDFEFERFENSTVYDFLLNNCDEDLVKMELDLYWITKAGFDPIKYFEKYPKRFPLWHVKDMDAQMKDFTEVGNGIIDFDRIFAKKNLAGLDYWFVEQDESNNPFESLKKSRDFLLRKNY